MTPNEPILETGSPAPDFTLQAANGRTLGRQPGRPLVLYFYPKADTSACTQEAQDFQQALPRFAALGVDVIGASRDPLPAVERFAEKYALRFPLGSDPDGKVADQFGVWVEKSMYGKKYMGVERATFLIDREGRVARIWRKVKVAGHIEEIVQAVMQLR